VLIAGLLLFLAGTVLCGLAWSLPVLIVGRVLQAGGGCAGMVLGRAIVRDLFDRERSASAIATITMAMSLAPSISPAIGAYLAEWVGWRADFALLGAVGAAVLVLTVAKLEETHAAPASVSLAGMTRSFVLLLRSPAFRGFAFGTAFTSASWFTFLASAPYLLSEVLHQPPSTYGLMILLPMVGYILGNAAVARLTVPFGITRLCVFGLALSLASGVMLAVWCLVDLTPWALFVPMAISSVGNGISQPPGIAAGLSVFPSRGRRFRADGLLANDDRRSRDVSDRPAAAGHSALNGRGGRCIAGARLGFRPSRAARTRGGVAPVYGSTPPENRAPPVRARLRLAFRGRNRG
jgi:DHA1 family bicyclomycin/chloramphenicol resistance-like MFS transporter